MGEWGWAGRPSWDGSALTLAITRAGRCPESALRRSYYPRGAADGAAGRSA